MDSKYKQDENNYVKLRGIPSDFNGPNATYSGNQYLRGRIETEDGSYPLICFTKCMHACQMLKAATKTGNKVTIQGKLNKYKGKFNVLVFWVVLH